MFKRGDKGMKGPTRRSFLAGATAAPLAAATAGAADETKDRIAADLSTYIGFGSKRSGGAGDDGCGHWLADELSRAGFAVEKLSIKVPWFDAARSEEHTSELQSLMRISYAVFCMKKKNKRN